MLQFSAISSSFESNSRAEIDRKKEKNDNDDDDDDDDDEKAQNTVEALQKTVDSKRI
jgi:hypothetical protein